jgi:hypothetical protein
MVRGMVIAGALNGKVFLRLFATMVTAMTFQ